MPGPATIFVTGATGNQGGAVASHLAKNGFKVMALTRNTASSAAQNLAKQNIRLIQGDLNEPGSFSQYLKDVDGIFSVQSFEEGVEKEAKQGIGLAKLAKENSIGHFIYSSVAGADLHTGIPHWESKAEIEKYIQQSGIPYTIIRPASLYENFLIPQVKNRLLKGRFVSPLNKKIIQQFVGSEDIGRISTQIFINPTAYVERTITLAAEQLDAEQVADIFSEMRGKPVTYQKLPALITRLAMGKKLYVMFRWLNENSGVFVKDMEEGRKEFPGMLSLGQWIQLNFK